MIICYKWPKITIYFQVSNFFITHIHSSQYFGWFLSYSSFCLINSWKARVCLQGWRTCVQLAWTQCAAVNAAARVSVTSLFFSQFGPKWAETAPNWSGPKYVFFFCFFKKDFIKTPIQKWDLEESIKIINSETNFVVLPALVHVSVCSCRCVSNCLCGWTSIYVHKNLYTYCERVFWRVSTRHLFLKEISFLPLTREVKRVSYSISFNIFNTIF